MDLTNVRAVIFDLDGTLMDTVSEIHGALVRAFAEIGVAPVSPDTTRSLVGKGVRSLVERALARQGSDADVDHTVEIFERHYAEVVGTEAALYPGAMDGVRSLKNAGYALGVVTNKPRAFTERLLAHAGIAPMMRAVVCGDDGIPRKPAADMMLAGCRQMGSAPGSTLMVGDSDNDILAARAAGCPVWCVPYGYNEGRPASALACDRLVASIDEAASLLLR